MSLQAKPAFFQSVQVRVLLLVVTLMLATTSLLTWYTLRQFEATTTFELEQEGILLSNALEANISPLVEAGDIAGLQDQLDRLVAARERNDIEINIMLLQGQSSAIVASNDPGNIEATSPEEHTNLLASLAGQQPVVLIGLEGAAENGAAIEAEEVEPPPSPDHPDFYLADGQRFLSITTPLLWQERQLGSINVKLSLARVDQELAATRRTLLLAQFIALVVVITGLIMVLNHQIFFPLRNLAETMQIVAGGDLSRRLAHPGPPNEIGGLASRFDQMVIKLQAAFERERRFTADIAHELRTPLTALKGRIGLTLTQPRSAAEYAAVLQNLEQEVDRLVRLSKNLLFLARLEQGQRRPHLEEQDFSALLGAIAEQMQPLAQAKHISLVEQISPGLTLQGDVDYLIRLMMNLLDNAIKYTPAGGQITLQANRHGRDVFIKVSDTGPGVPAEHIPALFDRFYRVAADRSRDSGGAGLGLAIAAEIVRAHQGRLEVHNRPGGGAQFVVSLPLEPSPPPV